MENRDILEEQRKELLEMFSHQQNKWAELNRKLIWVVISAFTGEFIAKLLGSNSSISSILLLALFGTTLTSFIIESFRFVYCGKRYFKLAEKIEQGIERNEYQIPRIADAITKVGLKCQLLQVGLFIIIIVEFIAYAISLLSINIK